MITRIFSPSTAATVFTAGELPEAIHGPVLQEVVMTRVASWSMTPTIRKDDRLELEQTDALQTGDVIVYRQDRLFVCHRIQRIEGQHLYLKGDANAGPQERITTRDVVGRVTTLIRDGKRLAVPPPAFGINQSAGHPTLERYATWSQEQGRSLGLRLIDFFVALPLVRPILRSVLGRVVTVDMMEQAPLQSLTGYVKRHQFQLCRTDRFEKYLFDLPTDLGRISFVIRVGHLCLGFCRLDPWNLQIRPLAAALGLEPSLQSIRSHLKTGESH